MKITYLICVYLMDIFLISTAIITPVYITPDYYWWTTFCLFLFFISSFSLKYRMDTWFLDDVED